jgi:putative transposase
MEGAAEEAGGLKSSATPLPELGISAMLRCRVRYFTDGAVIGSRIFVEEVFHRSRERFGPRRRNGARKLRGPASAAADILWSARDLRRGQ